MTSRSPLSSTAAAGIWVASVIGSWTMALAILGSINGAVIGCESDPATSDAVGSGTGGWFILAVASLVPVLVMIAVAPVERRSRLVGLAALVGAIGGVAAATLIGPCL